MKALLRGSVLTVLACTSACFGYSSEGPERPAPVLRKIEDADIQKMDVHLYKQLGLCPGLEGKLYANANVQWPGSKPVTRTLGSDVDSLHPSDFEITGPLIKGDVNAHLFPDSDISKSVEVGFDTTIVYKPNPTKFTFKKNFPPEYSCYGGWFVDGATGGPGNYGGDAGNDGLGTNGGNGGNGTQGNTGGQGGNITGWVTVVTTRYYPRLFAVMLSNGVFFLAPADRELTFGAAGGQGGTGGNGGYGGNGGDQDTEVVTRPDGKGGTTSETRGKGPAGNGGRGGNAGPGGNGGKGGTVDITFDSAFQELARFIKPDIRGGAPGFAGAPGGGGGGGQTNAEKNAKTGNPGTEGQGARDGGQGNPGSASVHPGNVASKFQSVRGIAIFGSPQAKAMAQNPPAGAGSSAPAAPSASAAPPPTPSSKIAPTAPTNNRPVPPNRPR